MAEDKKTSCPCGGIAAIVIAVLTILAMAGTITGSWVSIVVLILAIIIAIGAFAGGCICTKLCKPKEEAKPPAEPPPTQ
ncbi:MAG: hypothetical protein KAT11_05565 [Phycisphaerae bacterium]|nr:hypothetical protein [Phycisphaerae bacterium]